MPGAPPDLLCPFILPLRRPVVPLMVGGKWNKGLLLAPYPGLSLLPNPKPTAPTNLHRFVFRGTHHASVMPVIHFCQSHFLCCLEGSSWRPERWHSVAPLKMEFLNPENKLPLWLINMRCPSSTKIPCNEPTVLTVVSITVGENSNWLKVRQWPYSDSFFLWYGWR